MTSVSSNLALMNYLSGISKSDSSATSTSTSTASGTGSTADTDGKETGDPIGDLRRYAAALVAQSRGGLFAALAGGVGLTATKPGTSTDSASTGAAIQLPDVASISRDDAASLLPQVQKLIDKGMSDSLSVAGFNGDQQTSSLETYRDWLQNKAGISIYV